MVNGKLTPEELEKITQLKYTDGGRTLIEFMQVKTEELRRALELESDPEEVGRVGIILGKLRIYRGLEELLMGELTEQKG